MSCNTTLESTFTGLQSLLIPEKFLQNIKVNEMSLNFDTFDVFMAVLPQLQHDGGDET